MSDYNKNTVEREALDKRLEVFTDRTPSEIQAETENLIRQFGSFIPAEFRFRSSAMHVAFAKQLKFTDAATWEQGLDGLERQQTKIDMSAIR